MTDAILTQEELKSQLHYEPETGIFTRRLNTNSTKAGHLAGHVRSDKRVQIRILNKLHYAHRLAWLYMCGYYPDLEIDHKDGNPQNNIFSNLRLATRSENNRNVGKRVINKSGFKGVHWSNSANKWQVTCWANGKQNYLGVYDNLEIASKAYIEFAKKEHKQFLRL